MEDWIAEFMADGMTKGQAESYARYAVNKGMPQLEKSKALADRLMPYQKED